jgi:hypothetical protein
VVVSSSAVADCSDKVLFFPSPAKGFMATGTGASVGVSTLKSDSCLICSGSADGASIVAGGSGGEDAGACDARSCSSHSACSFLANASSERTS